MIVAVRSAQISFKGEIAGRLEETASGGTRFVYREGWRETIGCCLPAARLEHEWRTGLHPFFQHLGAEGWLRERQARTAHVAEEDDFGLLLRYGADCIGAVGVLPPTGEALPVPEANELASPGRTVSGVQRKLLVYRDEGANAYRPARASGPAPFIAKFNSDTRDDLVRNEFLSLRGVAALLGTEEVTAFQLGHVAELDEAALIVTRFDRKPDGTKLRLEDFAQILNKPSGRGLAANMIAYEDVAEVIREHSARPDIDLARLSAGLWPLCSSPMPMRISRTSRCWTTGGAPLLPVYDMVNIALYLDGLDRESRARDRGRGHREWRPSPRPAGKLRRADRPGDASSNRHSGADDIQRSPRRQMLMPPSAEEGRDGFGARYAEIVRNDARKFWKIAPLTGRRWWQKPSAAARRRSSRSANTPRWQASASRPSWASTAARRRSPWQKPSTFSVSSD